MADNAQLDIFALMDKNKRLSKNFEVAKKVVSKKDYSGPEGEVVCVFTGQTGMIFDSVETAILQFRVDGSVPGQEEYNGERIGLFFRFQDDPKWNRTVESVQNELMEAVQQLGIDTPNMTRAEIKAALADLQKSGKQIKIRVIKKKGKGANASKVYTNFRIIGLAKAGSEDTDYVDDEVEDTVDDVADESDEWEDELDETAEASDDEEGEWLPSDWIGTEVQYKPAKSPKPLKFKVIGADDKKRYVVLERNGKKTGDIPFDDLILPE